MKLIDVTRQVLSPNSWMADKQKGVRAVDTAGTDNSHGRLPAKTKCAAELAVLLWAVYGLLIPSAVANPLATNAVVNPPALTAVSANGSLTLIRGTFTGAPDSSYQINFYQSPIVSLSGANFVGSTTLATDAAGNDNFAASFPTAIPANTYVMATVNDQANNLSPVSNGLLFVPVNPVSLSLIVTASSNTVQYGDQFAIAITVTNGGPNAATGIAVNDVLPPQFKYAYSIATLITPTALSNNVTWNLDTLAPGGSATMTIYASGQAVGSFANRATLSADQYNINFATASNQIPVTIYSPSAVISVAAPVGGLLNGVLNLVASVLGGGQHQSYQWRLNGMNIPGATNATYSKANALLGDSGLYTLVVSDGENTTTSGGSLITTLSQTLGQLLSVQPSDSFAGRGPLIPIVSSLLPEVCDNINATSEPGEPMHAGVPGGKSVWFSWQPSLLLPGVATISTAGSGFDTVIAVYTGNSLSNLTEVASSDDDGGFYTSQVTFNVAAGTTYAVAIDGAYGASGQIIIKPGFTTTLLGAHPVPVITSQPTNQIVAFGATATFSVAGAGSGLSYQWYKNGAAISGATSVNLMVKNVQAANVGLYSVRVSNSGANTMSKTVSLQISMLDGAANAASSAADKFQSAYLAVLNSGQSISTKQVSSLSSFGIAGGHFVNDAGGGSRGYSSTQVFSTYGGGTQSGEPNHCGAIGGDSAWASVQAADNGVMTIDTAGTTFQAVLAVYTGNGDDFSTLTPVACDVNGGQGGTNSKVNFAATSNTVYYVAVDGVNGNSGTVILNANLSVPPTIIAQPVSQTVSPGATINLAAAANGHITPVCQWWHNGTMVVGGTNGNLSLTNFGSGKCGTYQMTATNTLGVAVTTPVALFLNTPMRVDSFHFDKTHATCQMRLIGTAGTSYVIQTSTDLKTWWPAVTNLATTGIFNWNDNHATNSQRYYRAVPGN